MVIKITAGNKNTEEAIKMAESLAKSNHKVVLITDGMNKDPFILTEFHADKQRL